MTLTTHRHREVAEGPAPGEALPIGRYVVLGRLGEGAMDVVYRAYDERLARKVALKLLQHTGRRDGRARVRLQREAQALAQLSHPNVVQIYDVGEWNGEDFVALEFVRGQTSRPGSPRARGRGRRSSRCACRRAAAWRRPTRPTSSTVTASPTTSWSASTGGSRSPTSASRSR